MSVLIVDDNYLVAIDLEQLLLGADIGVAGAVTSAAEALLVLNAGAVRAVTLEPGLREGPAFAFADRLQLLAVPFLFATAYQQSEIPHRFGAVRLIEKPFDSSVILDAVRSLLPL